MLRAAGASAAFGALTVGRSAVARGASRSTHEYDQNADQWGCRGVRVAIYEDPSVQQHNHAMHVYNKARDMYEQLYQAGHITGWSVTLYETTKEASDEDADGEFDAADVQAMLDEEGWRSDEDVQLWFTREADLWTGVDFGYVQQEVFGGSGAGHAFKSDAAAAWKASQPSKSDLDNPKRVVAHGAAMELMHSTVQLTASGVSDLTDGNGEHYLGKLIDEYNSFYGSTGMYGSPIAAGEDTWNGGDCSQNCCNDDTVSSSDKDGVTFTLAPCTKEAVGISADENC